MSIAIRELTLRDHAMLDELTEAAIASSGPSNELAPAGSGSKAFLADSSTFVFGAYVGHDVAGASWGMRVRQPRGSIVVEVRELFVLRPFRRRGIAMLLIESAHGLGRRLGAETLIVRTAGSKAEIALARAAGGELERDVASARWRLG